MQILAESHSHLDICHTSHCNLAIDRTPQRQLFVATMTSNSNKRARAASPAPTAAVAATSSAAPVDSSTVARPPLSHSALKAQRAASGDASAAPAIEKVVLNAGSIVRSHNRILVTGGCGFIGSHLIDRLMLDEKNLVICVDNCFSGSKSNIAQWIGNPRFEFIRHDVTNELLVEVDQIYHLACQFKQTTHNQQTDTQTQSRYAVFTNESISAVNHAVSCQDLLQ